MAILVHLCSYFHTLDFRCTCSCEFIYIYLYRLYIILALFPLGLYKARRTGNVARHTVIPYTMGSGKNAHIPFFSVPARSESACFTSDLEHLIGSA